MNTQQTIHVAMINSYNVILGYATIEEIVDSGIGVFTHLPEYDVELEVLETMIDYFQEMEMYEYCASLVSFINENWNEDRSKKKIYCECDLPSFDKYEPDIRCRVCNKRIK
jgi:hypothetical protein